MDTYAYVQQFPAAFAPLKPQFNLTGISDLYNQTDFIGISSYPSLTPNFSTEQLEAATQQFDFEIGQFGVDLKTLNVKQVWDGSTAWNNLLAAPTVVKPDMQFTTKMSRLPSMIA